ncbi:MAG: prephenate dehydratase domain-containing protein [Pseudomonadota bacterium]
MADDGHDNDATRAYLSGSLRPMMTHVRNDAAPHRPIPMNGDPIGKPARRAVCGSTPRVVAYPGSPGAFAHIAGDTVFPDAQCLACQSVIAATEAVQRGRADVAVLPCENILAGRVPDIHLMLPEMKLAIVGEVFQPIELHLIAPLGNRLDEIERVHSHPVALRQVRRFLRRHALTPIEETNTATAAAELARTGDAKAAAVASVLAAKTYGLEVLQRNIEDVPSNMTRFYILAGDPHMPPVETKDVLTCLLFEVRNAPGALFRVIRGFAERDINLTKLESYLIDGQFVATRFLCEFEGHPESPAVSAALEELNQHTTTRTTLGVFPKHCVGRRARADSEEPTAGSSKAPSFHQEHGAS